MSIASPVIAKTENRLSPLMITGVASVLLLAGLLTALGVSLVAPTLVLGSMALVWLAFQYPIAGLGGLLVFLPIFPTAFLLAKLLGPTYIGTLEGCDRAVMLGFALILLLRNGVRLAAPDRFLLVCFGLGALRFAFGGTLVNFLADFSFLIPYAAGRVLILTVEQERIWATRAVWLVAVLSVLGMSEVFIFGPTPRALLYSTFQSAFTSDGELSGAFYVNSYAGLRESSTMISPPYFALLCMVGLIIWWVYRRNLAAAVMIAAGLILTITRGAWISTAGAIALLAVVTGQGKRFLGYVAPGLLVAVASLYFLGLGEYVSRTVGREDPSAEDHVERVATGWEYVSTHPFGAGPGNYERAAGAKREVSNASDAPFIENTYLALAAAYGVLSCLCFLGFLLSAFHRSWGLKTNLGYTSIGILVGFGAAMVAAPLLVEFSLACWIWVPVGLAVRASTASIKKPSLAVS